LLDKAKDLLPGIFVVGLCIDIVTLFDIRNTVEDANQVEVVPGTKNLQLARHLGRIADTVSLLDSQHGVVDTGDGIVVVLPFVERADIVGCNLANLQQVDVLLHTRTAAAFIGIVGADIENPVG